MTNLQLFFSCSVSGSNSFHGQSLEVSLLFLNKKVYQYNSRGVLTRFNDWFAWYSLCVVAIWFCLQERQSENGTNTLIKVDLSLCVPILKDFVCLLKDFPDLCISQ